MHLQMLISFLLWSLLLIVFNAAAHEWHLSLGRLDGEM